MANTCVSIREFSRQVGVSDTAVRKRIYDPVKNPEGILINSKTLTGTGKPALWLEIALAEWKSGGGKIEKEVEDVHKEAAANNGFATPANDVPIVNTVYTTAKQNRAVIEAKIRHIQLQRLENTLVEKSKVFAVFFEFGQMIRDQVLQLPDNIFSHMENFIANGQPKEAYNLLYSKLEEILEVLSKGPDDTKVDNNITLRERGTDASS